MKGKISKNVIERLCYILSLLNELEKNNVKTITSKEMEERLNINSHTIRKDINFIGEIGPSPSGYPVKELKELINRKLGLGTKKNICIVGMGRLGVAVMNYLELIENNYKIVAGFDTNTNRMEIIDVKIPLYPTYRITEIVELKNIEIALIAISKNNVEDIRNKLIKGGVKGIINFSTKSVEPSLKKNKENVWIRNINLLNEFRKLSAMIELDEIN